MFGRLECAKLPKDGMRLDVIKQFANDLSGESGRKLPPKFRFYHILTDILQVTNIGRLFNKRLEFVWSLRKGVFERK